MFEKYPFDSKFNEHGQSRVLDNRQKKFTFKISGPSSKVEWLNLQKIYLETSLEIAIKVNFALIWGERVSPGNT